jgi:acetoin utilization deacetylase AcuC-like enzyme
VKVFYSDHFLLPLPQGHSFPIEKYARLRQRIDSAARQGAAFELVESPPASDAQLLRVHTPEYLEKVWTGGLSEKEMRRIGFPWSAEMVARSRRSVGGTIEACRAALDEGAAANLAGGTHHAYPDHGEGYCTFNDCAVAARVMQAEGRLARVVILDCDVHQGNGTAAIFRADPSVFTFSIHGEKNFPVHKETSDLDIALPDGAGDEQFLEGLLSGLRRSIAEARADLAIYLAGSDPYAGDRLGRLAVSKDGLAERDRMVYQACREAGLPAAVVMAGGYAREVSDTVEIHYHSILLASQMLARERG